MAGQLYAVRKSLGLVFLAAAVLLACGSGLDQWLLALLIYLERRDTWRLFAATTVLGFDNCQFLPSSCWPPTESNAP
jgi:hypothetical protein